LRDDHDLLLEAVREAGALAIGYFGRDVAVREKRPGQLVCEADIAVNALLAKSLRTPRPAYGWLSEEDADDGTRLDVRRVWIVDPIDGTRAFLNGRAEFTVAAALVDSGEPVAGAVFNPATDELFDAIAGGGARLNGRRIRVNGAHALAGARLLVGRTVRRGASWPAELGEVEFTAISSIAYKLALIAAGRFDAAVTLRPMSEWDVAAADLLVREAGGRVTTAAGAELRYNRAPPRLGSIIAAASGLHARLAERLAPIIARTSKP
jgi:myo-inositol-1(or 4)-monophosphatase